jgi:hypothetical protein
MNNSPERSVSQLLASRCPFKGTKKRKSPPKTAAVCGLALAVVGNDVALERAVEGRQHAALDEIEGGGRRIAGRAAAAGRS